MPGFVRRFRNVPPLEVIQRVEGVVITDEAPPASVVAAGSGKVLLVGEFEDGPFAFDAGGSGEFLDVFGTADQLSKYGGFGYDVGALTGQNPSARRHLSELWNGNGFLKGFGLQAQALVFGRVDTSVGSVSFSPLACITGARTLTTALSVGDTLSLTSDLGAGATAALAATAAVSLGVAGTYPTLFLGGESMRIVTNTLDRTVVFSAGDQLLADVVTRINNVMGFAMASDVGGELQVANTQLVGSASTLSVTNVSATPLTTFGLPAPTAGTGNVANIDQVTNLEVAGLVTATGLATGDVTADGTLRICSPTAGVGTITIAAGVMQAALALPVPTAPVAATGHAGGTIPAGTRVQVSPAGQIFVTMQTLDVPAGDPGSFDVKIRPALDDGTSTAELASAIDTVLDQPDFAELTVFNLNAVTAALTEPQMDAAYEAAFSASLDDGQPTRDANYLLCARRSDPVVLAGKQNAIQAGTAGLLARKYITGAPLGDDSSDAISQAASTLANSDRVAYTAWGVQVTVPEIAAVGTSGGLGFTADGVITVRPDTVVATLSAILPPEENIGQETELLTPFFAVNYFGENATIQTYEALKAGGVMGPVIHRGESMTIESDVVSNRTTWKRRKMADFIQDTLGVIGRPFVAKLNTQARRDSLRGTINQFLSGLLSQAVPELQRISAYSIDDGPNAGNTDATEASGVHFVLVKVRLLASLDDLVLRTQIGETVVVDAA